MFFSTKSTEHEKDQDVQLVQPIVTNPNASLSNDEEDEDDQDDADDEFLTSGISRLYQIQPFTFPNAFFDTVCEKLTPDVIGLVFRVTRRDFRAIIESYLPQNQKRDSVVQVFFYQLILKNFPPSPFSKKNEFF